ncbi:MAG: flagellar biosynthetic protein FliO [Oscillospiraceae bacterium]
MKEVLTVIVALLGIIGLIFLTYFASKWLNKRISSGTSQSIKILERFSISQDKSLAIVKVGGKLMLLGISNQHVEKISDLDETDIVDYLNPPEKKGNGTFFENLKKAASQQGVLKPFLPKGRQGEQEDDQ